MTSAPEPTFEQSLEELQTIVAKLEGGGLPLAESLTLWERGEGLAEVCQRWLDGARERIASARPDS